MVMGRIALLRISSPARQTGRLDLQALEMAVSLAAAGLEF
jgi:hypothetical protein